VSTRISLIHAMRASISPTELAFEKLWPEARRFNLLDDALSADLERDGAITPAMKGRFLTLSRYCVDAGAEAILFSCSAFGTAIDHVRERLRIPVLKPNEAMIEEALLAGSRLALLATFKPSLASIKPEIEAAARACAPQGKRGLTPDLRLVHVEGALEALRRGNAEEHDALIAEAAATVDACDALLLAQFSMARAAPRIRAQTGHRVLTSPESAVRKLKAWAR
jgi:Asp/Glu/hydantoin racemase